MESIPVDSKGVPQRKYNDKISEARGTPRKSSMVLA
jgi:hypothetical protein